MVTTSQTHKGATSFRIFTGSKWGLHTLKRNEGTLSVAVIDRVGVAVTVEVRVRTKLAVGLSVQPGEGGQPGFYTSRIIPRRVGRRGGRPSSSGGGDTLHLQWRGLRPVLPFPHPPGRRGGGSQDPPLQLETHTLDKLSNSIDPTLPQKEGP